MRVGSGRWLVRCATSTSPTLATIVTRIDQHHAAHLGGVGLGEELHVSAAEGVPEEVAGVNAESIESSQDEIGLPDRTVGLPGGGAFGVAEAA